MTEPNDKTKSQCASPEVKAAVRAVILARAALHPRELHRVRPSKITVRGSDHSSTGGRLIESDPPVPTSAPRPVPTLEALAAAEEAALSAFHPHVKVEARAVLGGLQLRAEGNLPVTPRSTSLSRPTSIPPNLAQRRPDPNVPPFPAAGLDDPDVREAWDAAYRDAAEARFLLQPVILKAYAEAQLACEKWDAEERGRKPSGDLRHPVPRNRLVRITAELTAKRRASSLGPNAL